MFVWNGVEYKGNHPALIDRDTFDRVEAILASRAQRGTRERRHHHYLKGALYCVCGRRLSVNTAKGHTYFYCLGQKDRRKPTECREAYVRAEQLEQQVEQLYQRVQLPRTLADRLRHLADEEMARHMDSHAAQREFQSRWLAKLEHERRKLKDVYYQGAVDITMLKAEQERIGAEVRDCERLLRDVSATLERWQRVLATALRFATDCAATYRRADERTRARYNAVVFERLIVSGGQIVDAEYAEPFGGVFSLPELEYGDLVPRAGLQRGHPPVVRRSAFCIVLRPQIRRPNTGGSAARCFPEADSVIRL